MTIRIVEDFVPDNHPIRPYFPMEAKYLTIHTTANYNVGANAEMHGRYLRSRDAIDREVLWHATVDDKEVRQHLPWEESGWHAGDGWDGPGNRESIGIELAVNADGDWSETLNNAALLVAYLYKQIPTLLPFPEGMKKHKDWSGKDCPRELLAPEKWQGFLRLCEDRMESKPWDPAAEIDRLMDAGLINTRHNPNAMPTWGELSTVLNRMLDKLGR